MSSKITGYWPQGRSTSKPMGLPHFGGGWFWFGVGSVPSLDDALKLSGEPRWAYLDWALEQRRKELMMESFYCEQMMTAMGDNWFLLNSPWHPKDKYLQYRILKSTRVPFMPLRIA